MMGRGVRYITYAAILGFTALLCLVSFIAPAGYFERGLPFAMMFLIAIVLMIAIERNLSTARQELTIRLVSEFVSNEQRVNDRELMSKSLPWPHIIQPGSPNFDDRSNLFLLSARRELDFLDVVAYAVLSEAVDESFMRQTFRRTVIEDAKQFGPFIAHWQKGHNAPWHGFVRLAQRWE
jgi:hypothetical protein